MDYKKKYQENESFQCPLVSVVIPAYNAERFIEQTLHSVRAQTYENLEVIIIDDGSSDRTAAIVQQIAQYDSRIKLIQQENKGVVAARNLAIEIAQGEFIAPLDADDVWLPQNLEKQVRCLVQSDSSVGLTYAWSADIDEYNQPTGEFHAFTIEGQVYSTLLCHDFIGNASSSLIRRSCFEKVDGYHCQKELPQGCEDWELYLRVAEQYQFRVVPEFLIGYRKHTYSMSFNAKAMAEFREAVWQSIWQKYPSLPVALYRVSNSSFYLYLARQSSLYNKPIDTLFWIYQMLRVDRITPFLRLGTYLSTATSVLSLILRWFLRPLERPQLDIKNKQPTQIEHYATSIAGVSDRSMAVGFKVFVGNVLHHWIPIFFGTSQSWQKNTSVQQEISQPSPNLPLVSVIIPVHNAEAFIEQTLNSVLAQTYRNIEVLVVDDGSQDKTAQIVRSVAQTDSRVVLLQQSNAGVAAARNTAIQASRGEFIAPIDADDIWYPQNLEKQVQCLLQSSPSVGFVYSWSLEIDEQNSLSGGFHASYHQGEAFLKLINQFFIGNASATLIRRICLEEVNGYNCNLRAQGAQGCEDWDLYLRIAERYQVRVVPEFLVGYRQITNSMSSNYDSMARSQALVLEAVRNQHPEIPPAIYQWSASRFYIYLAHRSSQNRDLVGTLAWLFRSLRLDLSMALIRHDLYLLLIQCLLTQSTNLTTKPTESSLKNLGSPFDDKATLDRIKKLMRIREFLPSTLYDKIRLRTLLLKKSYTNLRKLDPQTPLLEL